mgnify:CR=1 FL=1
MLHNSCCPNFKRKNCMPPRFSCMIKVLRPDACDPWLHIWWVKAHVGKEDCASWNKSAPSLPGVQGVQVAPPLPPSPAGHTNTPPPTHTVCLIGLLACDSHVCSMLATHIRCVLTQTLPPPPPAAIITWHHSHEC